MSRSHAPAGPRPAAAPSDPATGLLETLLAGAASPAAPAPLEAVTGHLDGIDDDGRVRFRPEGASESVTVDIAIEIPDGTLVKAARNARRALVLRTGGETPRWMLAGLVRERIGARARDAKPGELEVKVDGETVKLEAKRQIELSCGRSSLLLRADGRVVLSGVYVVTKSDGPMKIKGATIALN